MNMTCHTISSTAPDPDVLTEAGWDDIFDQLDEHMDAVIEGLRDRFPMLRWTLEV